jgi:hypothetical protein
MIYQILDFYKEEIYDFKPVRVGQVKKNPDFSGDMTTD